MYRAFVCVNILTPYFPINKKPLSIRPIVDLSLVEYARGVDVKWLTMTNSITNLTLRRTNVRLKKQLNCFDCIQFIISDENTSTERVRPFGQPLCLIADDYLDYINDFDEKKPSKRK